MSNQFRILVADTEQKYIDLYSRALSDENPVYQIDGGADLPPDPRQNMTDAALPIFQVTAQHDACGGYVRILPGPWDEINRALNNLFKRNADPFNQLCHTK